MGTETEDEGPRHFYEGWRVHLRCGACELIFQVEDDLRNGDKAACDACGTELEIEGAP